MINAGCPPPDIIWRDGSVPIATRFDDPYYSIEDGLRESTHVFLAGNDLPERLCAGFHIAELGFGTGLNLLCVARMLARLEPFFRISFTSFEAYPIQSEDMARALGRWPDLSQWSTELVGHWQAGARAFALGPVDVTIIEGDARLTLPKWSDRADAWFLDGFSPARNPEMWEPDLLAEVGSHTRPGGSFATYSAARAVRDGLAAAGFHVTKAPGFGGKRHMTRGVKPG